MAARKKEAESVVTKEATVKVTKTDLTGKKKKKDLVLDVKTFVTTPGSVRAEKKISIEGELSNGKSAWASALVEINFPGYREELFDLAEQVNSKLAEIMAEEARGIMEGFESEESDIETEDEDTEDEDNEDEDSEDDDDDEDDDEDDDDEDDDEDEDDEDEDD